MTRPVRVAHVTAVDLTHRFLLQGQLLYLLERGYEVTAISAPGPYVADIEAAGIRHIPWPHITRAWDPGADGRAMRSLVAILRRERFDVVHTHNPKPGVMGRIAARAARVPHVVNTVHGLYAMPEDRLAKRMGVLAVERVAARFSHHELYQSEEDLRWALQRRVVARSRSELLGNGIDVAAYDRAAVPDARVEALRRELGIPAGAPVVGAVGRLVAEKGYRELFAAAAALGARMPDVRFLVVGSPDPEKADAIRDEEVAAAGERVVFAGWRTDVRDLMALMDVFVLASHREGVPRSAIEAAAMSRPLVLTDIRGCREVARNGIEGLLVPPRDPAALASAIELLLRDAELRERMGLAARARAVERFDETRVFETIARTYERLLLGSSVRPRHGEGVAIRRAERADAPALARLHRRCLPGSFLPTLGDGFLRRLYEALADEPDAVTFVAEEGGSVIGFSAGVRSVRGFYRRFFVHHGVAAGVAALPYMLRPSTLRRAYETARYSGGGADLPDAELLSIAVSPDHRIRGLGKRLARSMLAGLADLGARDVKVVVAAANESANRFYERIGFRYASTINVHEGTPSNVWIYRCRSSLRSA